MNMTQADIARLENNSGDASLDALKRLAAVLGVEMVELIAAIDANNEATNQAS